MRHESYSLLFSIYPTAESRTHSHLLVWWICTGVNDVHWPNEGWSKTQLKVKDFRPWFWSASVANYYK